MTIFAQPVSYRQSAKLQHVRYDVRGPNLVEAQRMEAEGHKVLRLNIGNTAPFGFEAPEAIVQDMVTSLPDAQGYSDSRGIHSARKAVQQYYQSHGILDLDIDHIFIGNGVSELISLVLQALVDDGDEILIPAPDYPLWTGAVSLSGGRAVHYVCDEASDWNPDPEDIRSRITSRTKALVVINPNNPTGAVYSEETLRELVQIAAEHRLILLTDEIYEKIVFDGAQHRHLAALAGDDDVLTLTFSGLSKAYRVCGYRSGWLAITGPVQRAENLIEGITLLSNMRMCANVPGQYAIQAALGGYQSIDALVAEGGRLREQRDFAYRQLNEIPGVSCNQAAGALYLFPRLDPEMYPITDDAAWALGLLREKKVLVSHGTGFNWPRPDHFRLVTLPSVEVLDDAIGRIAEYLEDLRARR
ncbi:pyridoxal phosphate-dependent aminotransferase [Sediminivirga luteola]|uniref:pyridoxal phosphate-dependent aminotransferase n=1 Tax=Sediminivirga luteola TaxID=1774748 RepID=UPI001F565D43|nr:pyridoxal phosphate-dependent aminotransferase [Sediminivirga luteola]MCI2265541.1 pyridoxal phosphate-dependent aminotransferase [Sediminivirga luteola]